jgi:hypothetical protein
VSQRNGGDWKHGSAELLFTGLADLSFISGERPDDVTVARGAPERARRRLMTNLFASATAHTVQDTLIFGSIRPRFAAHSSSRKQDPRSLWFKMRERRHPNIVAVALANKNARIAWSLLAGDKIYDPRFSVRTA